MTDHIVWRKGHRLMLWPAAEPNLADQIIVTDGGPWATHNVVCAVCGERGAMLDLNLGIFLPCDICRGNGWVLKRKRKWGIFR